MKTATVRLELTVTDADSGKPTRIFGEWPDQPYSKVLAIEVELKKVLDMIHNWGVEAGKALEAQAKK